jgi:hypothetical protein
MSFEDDFDAYTAQIAVPWSRMCFAQEQVFELDDEASDTLLV